MGGTMKGLRAGANGAPMEFRTLEIREVSTDGTFEGYLSKFNDEDMMGDVVLPGAFAKSLKEKGPKRPLLWQHSAWEPIGVLTAKEDNVGLLITGNLNLDVQRAREAHSLLKQRAVTGLSQGFVPEEWTPRKTGAGRDLKVIDLWEGSLATFPALPSAQIHTVRSALPPWLQESATEQAEAQAKALREERLQRLARVIPKPKA